jgi:hypothetical protein
MIFQGNNDGTVNVVENTAKMPLLPAQGIRLLYPKCNEYAWGLTGDVAGVQILSYSILAYIADEQTALALHGYFAEDFVLLWQTGEPWTMDVAEAIEWMEEHGIAFEPMPPHWQMLNALRHSRMLVYASLPNGLPAIPQQEELRVSIEIAYKAAQDFLAGRLEPLAID